MFKNFALLLLILVFSPAVIFAQQKSDSSPSPILDQLTEQLEAQRQQMKLPALNVAVVRDKEIIYKHAFGYADLAKQIPATVDMKYPIGSITKVFASTMLMQLAERGIVRLDDPVTRYIPEYKVRSRFANTQPTTLRQLASHASGLPRDAPINFWMNYTLAGWVFSQGKVPLKWYASPEETLKSLPTVKLEDPPNSIHNYSNLGMTLLGLALERTSGTTYERYMEENIFRPLGMKNTGFITDTNQDQFPVGYVYVPGRTEPLVAPKWQLGSAKYSGGIYSTVEDMARFLLLQFQDEKVGGAQILSGDSLRAMRVGTEGMQCGIGWWGNEAGGHHIVIHNGGHLGYLATVAVMPDMKLGVVLMTNRDNPMSDLQTHTLAIKTLEMLATKLAALEAPPAFDTTKVDLHSFAGTYAVPGNYARLRFVVEDGALYRTLEGVEGSKTHLYPAARNQFSEAPGAPPTLSFRSDEAGKPAAVNFALFWFDRVD